jgi:hypothetical protein
VPACVGAVWVQEAEEYFSKWEDEGVVDFMAVFSELIILTASRTLLGEPLPGSLTQGAAVCCSDRLDWCCVCFAQPARSHAGSPARRLIVCI